MKIRIIAYYFFKSQVKSLIKKYLIIYCLNKIINYYNIIYVDNCISSKLYNCDYEQQKAIYIDELYTIVIAGAGSGKTSTIVEKIDYLIQFKGILPKEIICFSFTNEACNHLLSKLKYKTEVFTFHKFALKVLKNDYRINNSLLKYVIDEYFRGIILNDYKMQKKVKKYFKVKYYQDIFKLSEYNTLKKDICHFISLFKCNGYDYSDFLKLKYIKNRTIYRIIIDIYSIYISELSSQRLIDLDLLIVEATKKIRSSNFCYKYIFIDEFQDISKIRFNLVMELIKVSNAKLFAVGDDYQAIYRFSGCSLNYFLNFCCNKTNSKVIKLKNNYRCCQDVVNITNRFIQKNKRQVKKYIIAHKYIERPIIIINERYNILIDLIENINDAHNILVLGRNNNDIYNYITEDFIDSKGNIIIKQNVNIMYKTIHCAKGLEADCVILINMRDSINGFPSKMINKEFISDFFENDYFPYEEERRLFYVALTRSKGLVYILKPIMPSIFLKEIIANNKKHITFLSL